MPGLSRVLSVGLRLYSVSSIRIVLTTESLDSDGALPPPPPPLPLCAPEQPTASESVTVTATNHTTIARLFIKPFLCASCRRTSLFIRWMTYRRTFSSGLLGAESPKNILLSILSSDFNAWRVGWYPLGTRALLLFRCLRGGGSLLCSTWAEQGTSYSRNTPKKGLASRALSNHRRRSMPRERSAPCPRPLMSSHTTLAPKESASRSSAVRRSAFTGCL